ncbi:MAG: hypothetical protein ACE5KY_06215 [Candidatus Tectimicrobiota bacterium]
MTNQGALRRLGRVVLGLALALAALSTGADALGPESAAVRVAVAPVADRRALAFPDRLPLRVDSPFQTLTAQPRGLPEELRREVETVLSATNGIEVVEAPELAPQPSARTVRAVASGRRLDAVVAGVVTTGFGQMQVTGYRRRAYIGRVQVELTVLSGRTGRALGRPLVLVGTDETDVDFRRRSFDTLHHRGSGPEVRERLDEAVRDVGRQLRGKLSGAGLAAALAAEDRSPRATAGLRLTIERMALEPDTLWPGQAARMVIAYTVSGLEAGAFVDVTETRRLLRAGHIVAGPFQVVHTLGNGTHTSVQELHVPPSAAGGRYVLSGAVEAAGAQASGSGSFTVRAPGQDPIR